MIFLLPANAVNMQILVKLELVVPQDKTSRLSQPGLSGVLDASTKHVGPKVADGSVKSHTPPPRERQVDQGPGFEAIL